MPFQQMIIHALKCQHDIDVHLLFCFDLDGYITSISPPLEVVFYLDFLRRSSLMGTTLRAVVPSKIHAFKQISMHALPCQHDVDVHLLFCYDIDLRLTCSQVHV